jgi:hypothetical protein
MPLVAEYCARVINTWWTRLNLTEAANALFASIDFNRHIIPKCALLSHCV